jgi:hypothetical protein
MTYEQERPNIPAEIRRLVMTQAGHCCIVQHCIEHIVEIHHIDENRENNDPANLAVLCDKHHKLAHNKTISRLDLKRYKELLSSGAQVNRHQNSSEHDRKLLIEINEIFPYETITLIKNEAFGKFVRQEVIEPFFSLAERSGDPLFKFTDTQLESLRAAIIGKGQIFMRHFAQQSAGLIGGYEYIDIAKIAMTHPQMVDHWEKYSMDTVELAHDFCASMLQLRAELINYA